MGIDAEMFVRTQAILTQEFVDKLAYDLGAAFGPDRFWIWDAGVISGEPRKAAMVVSEMDQDEYPPNDVIRPRPGETFIRISPGTRFYGKGYERGDLPFLIALAAFVEAKVPGGEVWYGGDSSGVLFQRFGAVERSELFDHFVKVDHQPYDMGSIFSDRVTDKPRCSFCAGHEMNAYGSGPGKRVLWHCRGCGAQGHTESGQWVQTTRPGGMKIEEEAKSGT